MFQELRMRWAANVLASCVYAVGLLAAIGHPATAGDMIRTALPHVEAVSQENISERLKKAQEERRRARVSSGTVVTLPTGTAVPGLTPMSDAAGVSKYETVRVRFVGSGVDLELGSLLSHLAATRPELLKPTPVDWPFVYEQCVNLFAFPPIVAASIDRRDPDALLYRLLGESDSFIPAAAGGPVKYTITPRTIARYNEVRPERSLGVDEEVIRGLDIRTAFSVLESIETHELALDRIRDPLLRGFLRNLGIVSSEGSREELIVALQRAVGLRPNGIVGPDTIQAINDGDRDQIWEGLFKNLIDARHCQDADKVFRAYGLTYRSGDYPSARKTIRLLATPSGEEQVPVLDLAPIAEVLIESIAPNCSVFTPFDEKEKDSCIFAKMESGGSKRYATIAEGIEIRLAVLSSERDAIVDEIRRVANRNGGLERRRVSILVDQPTQPEAILVPNVLDGVAKDYVPCIEDFSALELTDLDNLKTHIKLYKELFYPKPIEMPKSYPVVQLFDHYPGESEVVTVVEQVRGRLPDPPSPEVIIPTAGETPGPVGPSEQDVVENYIRTVCEENDYLKGLRKLTHGRFLQHLVVGGEFPIAGLGHIGLLTFDGAQGENEIGKEGNKLVSTVDSRDDTAIKNNLTNVATIIARARDALQFDHNINYVINVSLSIFLVNDDAISQLATPIEGLYETGLVVAPAASIKDASPGLQLERLSLDDRLAKRSSTCLVFPACFSYLPNVITVAGIDNVVEFPYQVPRVLSGSHTGSAVTVAAPGVGIVSNDMHYFRGSDGADGIDTRMSFAMRDGSSVAAVFVSALAAEVMARHALNSIQTKEQIVATTRPFLTESGEEEFLKGANGTIAAGVIDVEAALRDPERSYVTKMNGETTEYEAIKFLSTRPAYFSLFGNVAENAVPSLYCKWKDILRLHIFGAYDEDHKGNPIYKAGVVCRDPTDRNVLRIANGYLGTKNNQEDPCITGETCFIGVRADTKLEENIEIIQFSDLKDLYIAVDE